MQDDDDGWAEAARKAANQPPSDEDEWAHAALAMENTGQATNAPVKTEPAPDAVPDREDHADTTPEVKTAAEPTAKLEDRAETVVEPKTTPEPKDPDTTAADSKTPAEPKDPADTVAERKSAVNAQAGDSAAVTPAPGHSTKPARPAAPVIVSVAEPRRPAADSRTSQSNAPQNAARETRAARAPGPPRRSSGRGLSRRAWLVLVAAIGLAAVVTAAWLAGAQNHRNFYIHCGPTRIIAERGDFFPPWGTEPMLGPAWEPIDMVLPFAQCDDATFARETELRASFRDKLLAQARQWLGSLRLRDSREHLETINKQLEQALLLSRGSDEASAVARKTIGRLLGDIEYWQAHDELGAAKTQLHDAMERFRAAVDKTPVYVRTADEWRKFMEHIEAELDQGPPALRPEPAPVPPPVLRPEPSEQAGPEQPPAQVGAEPDGAGLDAGVGEALPPHADAAPPAQVGAPGSGTLL